MLSAFSGKRVLLLQGPMGLFFWRLRQDLQDAGAQVLKINLCPGDRLFYPSHATAFRGTLDVWPDFLDNFIIEHDVDIIMLFGDCRHYHIGVPEIARRRQAQVYVFEEGYIRPDFITVERGGTNNFSSLPRDPDVYRAQIPHTITRTNPLPVKHAFSRAALFAILYALANALLGWRYPHYRHHRSLEPLSQAFYWIRSWVRKIWFRHREAGLARTLFGPLSGRFFLVPLQTHNDAQISVHSDYDSIEEFIGDVLCSFARQAAPDVHLVFKHHPLDRGYRDYGRVLKDMTLAFGLEGRVHYVHDVHLPTLLDKALGTIVINSTVGLSSLLHDTPVCVMGDPVYHMPGLTFHGRLDDFWSAPGKIDRELYLNFRAWLLAWNQANGNFYRRLSAVSNRTGMVWPPSLGLITASQPQPQPQPAEPVYQAASLCQVSPIELRVAQAGTD
ncbi:Capsule polysaccharide biosynthesis protein [Thiorhodococcus drewsii AZ1]|uniref:Capsule polysaccharide biosynthesis protein n=1 Tax=Thiorhodococcus drewsii AZ1 TaxID=765913 RepID=G2E5V5_9GAMM|nr:capsular biosynthesis protein [Thiorhodococcus drewsii]EGV28518.1 Capsule polysaccharide biosynthesis protein [Thiorhodococcus drewsii AZ1]